MGERMLASGSAKQAWNSTRVTRLLRIDYPIIQAPFGGLPSQQLTANVSNLGGLGSLGAVTLSSSAITEVIGEIRSLTTKPFAINLWVSTSDREAAHISSQLIEEKMRELGRYYAELGIEPPLGVESKPQNFEAQVRAAIDARSPVLSFVYGIPPSEILDECRTHEIKTIGTATTPEEAVALEQAGLNFIVASGFEGGGHRGSFLRSPAESLMGSFSLIPQVVDAVEVPVIAAGGIADGRGLLAALALGAEAVQIGTAFLPCAGSGASKAYRAALLSETAKWTELTDAFTGRLARGVRNRLMNEFKDMSRPSLPFPSQHAMTQTVAAPASAREKVELMTLWAGQSAGLSRHTEATELISQLIAEADGSATNDKKEWLQTRPGERCLIHISAADTNGLYSLVEIVSNPGDGTPLHVHEREDEHIIVVEGTARIVYGDKIFDAQPGDVAILRKGIPHAWGNRTNAELRIAVFARPGGIEEVLRLVATTAEIDLAAIAERFRVKVIGSAPF